MIVITSAAYVDTEFCAEVGKLPPAMLPVANKRLFEHQVETLKQRFPKDKVYLSLPEGYQIPKKDQLEIDFLGINIIRVPENISLANSLLYVVNSIGEYDNTIRVLHGDTLIDDLPLADNVLAIAKTNDDYNWEVENKGLTEEMVWSGFFSFNDIRSLVKVLVKNKNSFVDAVKEYSNQNKMDYKEVSNWMDFGHINNYFKSRSMITTQREFNSLRIENGIVIKSSFNEKKILAESAWFADIPNSIKFYTPQQLGSGYLNSNQAFYKLEYLSCIPLNEVYVHALNSPFFWSKIFKHIRLFLSTCAQVEETNINKDDERLAENYKLLVVEKTKKRVLEYIKKSDSDFDLKTSLNSVKLPSLNSIMEECILKVKGDPYIFGILHGDLCFSNILYDTRSDRIKVVDPRGLDINDNFSCLGDLRYDYSKLNHSVIGLYDYIVAGAYSLNEAVNFEFEFEILIDDRVHQIQEIYMKDMKLAKLSPLSLMPETILLFFAMLPLHADSPKRQRAFIANILRLYSIYLAK